jgi:hypothetical protein
LLRGIALYELNSTFFYLFFMLTLLQGQNQSLGLNCVFNLDSSLSESQAGSDHRTQLNNAINELSKVIWREGGFRFWHRRTNKNPLKYIFYCAQDKDRTRQRALRELRDTPQMERFSCGGYFVFIPSLLDRTLAITLRHTYYKPDQNHDLSEAVLWSSYEPMTLTLRLLKFFVTYRQRGLRGGSL